MDELADTSLNSTSPPRTTDQPDATIWDHVRRFMGFSLMPACSLLASLILLPLISSGHGQGGFIALGVGQSVGAILGVIASLAWPTIGGNAVARAEPAERRKIFTLSIYSRLIAMSVLMPIGVVVCLCLVHDLQGVTCVFMAGTAFNAMTAGWFYSGLGEPGRLVINEGVVRLVGYAVSALALGMGAPLATYAVLIVVSGLLSLVLNWVHILGPRLPHTPGLLRETLATMADHRLGTASRVFQSAFYYGGTAIFAATASGPIAVFVALDQLQRATGNATVMFPQTFVSWVGKAQSGQRHRSRIAFSVMALAALTVTLAWIVLGPTIVAFLFAGKVEISRLGCSLVGLNAGTTLLALTYQLLVMIPLGLDREVFRINSGFSLIGVLVLAALSTTGNDYLAFSTWSVMAVLLLGYLMIIVRRTTPASRR